MPVRFGAIGFAHPHIFDMVTVLLGAGAEMAAFYDDDPAQIAQFTGRFPHAQQAPSIDAILEDETIDLIVSATIPNTRALLGIRAMQHGKDYLCAKPGLTDFEQLAEVRRVQAETGQKYIIYYGERLHNPATVKAGELVHAGAIGRVAQTVGFGPHRLLGSFPRPEWAFQRAYSGGIINDLASHQIDQFLYFTGSTQAQVVAAHVGNMKHGQFPNMHDFGDVVVRSPSAVGYIRVDWLTPDGLDTWGDVLLFIMGTEGTIELRKNIDLAGRAGGNHLFLVNGEGTQYIDCQQVPLPFAAQFLADVEKRTETAISQVHCLLAAELALTAEQQAFEMLR
ncbi:MAG: Gfo/Idh/MocA family oxidoreductase [Chloroflexota bacterium]